MTRIVVLSPDTLTTISGGVTREGYANTGQAVGNAVGPYAGKIASAAAQRFAPGVPWASSAAGAVGNFVGPHLGTVGRAVGNGLYDTGSFIGDKVGTAYGNWKYGS
jgi:hypothetical protein